MPPEGSADPALGGAIRRLRLAAGISQEELANRADTTMATLGRIERNERNATWSTITGIAKALGVSLVELAAAIEGMEHH
jgi:transcriptional regulator with XRE-family HTH domain